MSSRANRGRMSTWVQWVQPLISSGSLAGSSTRLQCQLTDGIQAVADEQEALPLSGAPLAYGARHVLAQLLGGCRLVILHLDRDGDGVRDGWLQRIVLGHGVGVLVRVEVDPREEAGDLVEVGGALAVQARHRPGCRGTAREELDVEEELPRDWNVLPSPRL